MVRVGNNRPDLGTNPICNRFTGHLEEGKPLFLPCNPPMPGAFVSVHLEGANLSQLSICEAFVYTDQVLILFSNTKVHAIWTGLYTAKCLQETPMDLKM
jgi:hypothetical protein